MTDGTCPVVLVHGWNSHPGVWNRITPRLDAARIPYWRFDHSLMQGTSLTGLAAALGEFIALRRTETGYQGKIDIICHSVGTCIARYYLEVIDGKSQREEVRQLIGIGPPNNGSALAELFHDPDRGSEVIRTLTGIFVPPGFDPSSDAIVQDVRPKSPVMQELRAAGTRDDIAYRIIVTANPEGYDDFFPWFGGKTWEIRKDGTYYATLDGDGVVPHRESRLPNAALDVLPADLGTGLASPSEYCHINLPRNPLVIDRIMEYLSGSV